MARTLFRAVGIVACLVSTSRGQTVVSTFSDGIITWTNGTPGYTYRVEWAPTVGGPWTGTWDAQRFITISNSGGTSTVPMFYRIASLSCPCTNDYALSCPGTNIGSVCGDDGPVSMPDVQGCSNAWLRFTLSECQAIFFEDLRVRVTLASPGESNFDLHLYTSCGSPLKSSTFGSGLLDSITHSVIDTSGDQSTAFILEVRQVSVFACSNWTLTITGDY